MYSFKELKLLNHFGVPQAVLDYSISDAYQMAVNTAFVNRMSDYDPYVKSLRRCWVAFRNVTVYRNTEEWDDLIRLE